MNTTRLPAPGSRIWVLVVLLGLASPVVAQQRGDDVVFRAMRDELARAMSRLRLDTLPAPYFIAYRLTESTSIDASATFGSLVRSNDVRNRSIAVELRVGDYTFDNSNFAGGGFPVGGQVSLEDDYQEIRRQLWLVTDNAYKSALEQIAQKRAALRNVTRTEDLPDFSRETRDSVVDEVVVPPADRKQAEQLVLDLSRQFREMPDVFNSSASWSSGETRVRYVNSEGTTFSRRSPWAVVRVTAATQAPDGSALDDALSWYAARPADLPVRDTMRAAVNALGVRLASLRAAPVLDQYNGPVLFEDEAAAGAFSSVFAPRLLASRRAVSRSGGGGGGGENNFIDQIGGRVLPSFMSVTDDATRTEYGGVHIGGYLVDDDGIRSRPTLLVERGILKTLLNGRVPVRGILKSTGNRVGTAAGGISNLFVTAEGGVPRAELRKRLLDLATQRGRDYGVVIRRVWMPVGGGGMDLQSMMMMQQFGPGGMGGSLRAVEAWRVYPDGREELIRNADVTGLAPATFKEIVAVSDSSRAYTLPRITGGYAASFVVPSVLFEDLTVRGPRGEVPKPPVAKHPYFDRP